MNRKENEEFFSEFVDEEWGIFPKKIPNEDPQPEFDLYGTALNELF